MNIPLYVALQNHLLSAEAELASLFTAHLPDQKRVKELKLTISTIKQQMKDLK